eukprot:CAMPEP_0206147946 /NCGR_PEP_ID=MMETSP1473-20131121/35096_1 /ASSEMBLY_ACC=CAM_ASM_001109 /TAXON_ID=1461547 /ORGANISM="Stichococcus sp, Strain RCC1054" /LENGTH=183 /DNA_ID=CAMNT_0053545105 /DNA_START=326 /DNA_END=873 /DNA_ORIENTATION=-
MASTYSLAIDVQSRQAPGEGEARAASNATELASDSIAFSAGNPRVEFVQGVVHLYRGVQPADTPATWADHVKGSPEALGNQLAVLAVQPEMGVSEFCDFLGGFLASVREMRFVRRDDVPRGDCLVLLTFDTPATAARFYQQHNQKPFWTLEPDILCRLLFVKHLQFSDQPATSGATGGGGGGG